ncbi:UNKNOWN [Stylonychia lemnae]|uniref:Uncharacterized protein n=1 Tax=Stylonychia lemnae TaxID=5949 RepID=A0A078B0G3_STYLE|nr:UNKNOWN [Stylonychia lemnae]|eukprot:CDW87801.1 UNKNOWN [Stylonychia lemnae]
MLYTVIQLIIKKCKKKPIQNNQTSEVNNFLNDVKQDKYLLSQSLKFDSQNTSSNLDINQVGLVNTQTDQPFAQKQLSQQDKVGNVKNRKKIKKIKAKKIETADQVFDIEEIDQNIKKDKKHQYFQHNNYNHKQNTEISKIKSKQNVINDVNFGSYDYDNFNKNDTSKHFINSNVKYNLSNLEVSGKFTNQYPSKFLFESQSDVQSYNAQLLASQQQLANQKSIINNNKKNHKNAKKSFDIEPFELQLQNEQINVIKPDAYLDEGEIKQNRIRHKFKQKDYSLEPKNLINLKKKLNLQQEV